jgi:thioredoxin-related protein
MMKIIAIFLLITSIGYSTNAETFTQKLEIAKTENKNVLLYFSGSDWCAPCIKFKKFIVNSPEFQAFATDNLIVYNADFPRLSKNKLSKELTKENEDLADKYNSKGAFPLILLLDTDGKILKEWDGFPKETVEEFISKLKK